MIVHTFPDSLAAARAAAARMAELAREAVAARGRFTVALSGGHSPWRMLEALAGLDVPWTGVHVFQIDERVAPAGDPDRNATHIAESLLGRAPIPADRVHLMPVESGDLPAAAARYAETLAAGTGSPAVLDLAHLGLGPDGHTASLVPGDPVLDVRTQDVALTGVYQGHRRMTLTYPALARGGQLLWLVTGPDKKDALAKLLAGDESIPASRVQAGRSLIMADESAVP